MHTNIKKHLNTCMQRDNMKLHAKSSKLHIEHTQNGATVQHIHSKQDITICPKQQLGILRARKQHTTGTIHGQQGHSIKIHIRASK